MYVKKIKSDKSNCKVQKVFVEEFYSEKTKC